MVQFKELFSMIPLTEASFRSEKIIEVCKKYSSLLSKAFNAPLRVWTAETFKRCSGETGYGVRLTNRNGYMLRLNFSNLRPNTLTLNSLDYWNPGNNCLTKPSVTCRFSSDLNVIGIWNTIMKFVLQKRYGKYYLDSLNEDIEKGSIKSRKAFLASKGIPQWRGVSPSNFEVELKNNNLENEWHEFIGISAGVAESNTTDDKMNAATKAEKSINYKDPDVIFKDIGTLIELLLNGRRKLMTVCGIGGMGKTYEVKKNLNKLLGEPPNYVYISAPKITPRQFYEEVFLARDKIICFDEADNILLNDEIVTMLKPALDTTGDNAMTYNTLTKRMTEYNTKEIEEYCYKCDELLDRGCQFVTNRQFNKDDNIFGTVNYNPDKEATGIWLPSKFIFTGKMIFISNLPLERIDRALLTRGPRVNVSFDLRGKVKRIATVLQQMGYSDDLIDIMRNTLEKEENAEVISVRTAIGFTEYVKSGDVNVDEALRLASNYG